jgi:APA family basic amino acid/polyamine antiporter
VASQLPRAKTIERLIADAAPRERRLKKPLGPRFRPLFFSLCGLLTGLTVITSIRFVVWLALGVVVYALYGRRHSEFAHSAGGGEAV